MQRKLKRPALQLKTIPQADDEPVQEPAFFSGITPVTDSLFIGGELNRLRRCKKTGIVEGAPNRHRDQPGLGEVSEPAQGAPGLPRLRYRRQTDH